MQQQSRSSPLLWVFVGVVAVVGISALAPHHATSSQTVKAAPASTLVRGTRPYYIALARQDALAVHYNPDFFVNQIETESHFNPSAVGSSGEVGIAQFMPETARAHGINPADPEDALAGAAHIMAHYLSVYSGDYAKALSAYNAGPGATDSAIARGGANWQAYIPRITRRYIQTILGGVQG